MVDFDGLKTRHRAKLPSYVEAPPEKFDHEDSIAVTPPQKSAPKAKLGSTQKDSSKSDAEITKTQRSNRSTSEVGQGTKRKRDRISKLEALILKNKRPKTTASTLMTSGIQRTTRSTLRSSDEVNTAGDNSELGTNDSDTVADDDLITHSNAGLQGPEAPVSNDIMQNGHTGNNNGESAFSVTAQQPLIEPSGVLNNRRECDNPTEAGYDGQRSTSGLHDSLASSPLSSPPSSPALAAEASLILTSISLSPAEIEQEDMPTISNSEYVVQHRQEPPTPEPSPILEKDVTSINNVSRIDHAADESAISEAEIGYRITERISPVVNPIDTSGPDVLVGDQAPSKASPTQQPTPSSTFQSAMSQDEQSVAPNLPLDMNQTTLFDGTVTTPSRAEEPILRNIPDQRHLQNMVVTPNETQPPTSLDSQASVNPKSTSRPTTARKTPASGPKGRNTKAKGQSQQKPLAERKKATTRSSRKASATVLDDDSKVKKSPRKTKPSKVPQVPQKRPEKTPKKRAKKTPQSLFVKISAPQQALGIDIDPKKLTLSQELTKRETLESGLKRAPQGEPEVWADSRQALCETLPYFKKPQGGCYQNDGHVYGFLFDGVGHCREYLDNNVIICRAGGGMEPDSAGGMVQRKDQSMNEAQVQAVMNDIAHHNPVIVICGDRNKGALCKMPHQYCVLDWYKPTMVWSEKTAGKGTKVWTTVKYRLERLNRHKPAWHTPTDHRVLEEEELAVAGPLHKETCGGCNNEYPRIYLQGWMCLTADCPRFWKINDCNAPYGKDRLDYDPAFLLYEHSLWKGQGESEEPTPSALRPPVPDVGNVIGDNLAHVNTRGICCHKCGRCSSRRFYNRWKCENPNCDYEFIPEHRPVIPAMLHTPWDSAPTLVRNRHQPSVKIEVRHVHGYKISIYSFEGIQGSFIHAAASKQIVREVNGPDSMFKATQEVDMGLERRTFSTKKMSGGKVDKGTMTPLAQLPPLQTAQEDVNSEDMSQSQDTTAEVEDDVSMKKQEFEDGDLMTAFSMNYGMPYKFVANGASKPFEGAPWPVTECRRRLNWAQQEFLKGIEDNAGQPSEHDDKSVRDMDKPTGYRDFNEELIFAYLEGQKIEYHDDGEQGLGPRIATLSLGGRAKMHIRMKMKHYVGCSKTGVFTEEEPIPGGFGGPFMDQKRKEQWNQLQQIKHDGSAYAKLRKEIPKDLGIFEKRTKKADDLVTVTLSHGDIIIMDGYAIQKYLEHKVVPEGYLRFALTCRTVLEDHLKPEERPNYTVEEDSEKYTGSAMDEAEG